MTEYTNRQLQIIDTAIELIAEGGIQELTMKRLSGRIGISEPAIYRHFESKSAILEAIQSFFSDEKRMVFAEVLAGQKSGIEKIISVIESHFLIFSQKPAMTAVIFSEEIFQNDQQLADMVSSIMEQSRQMLLQIVSAGQTNKTIRADIPAEHIVTIIMGSLRLIVKKWYLSKYKFDLKTEGQLFSGSLKKILEPDT